MTRKACVIGAGPSGLMAAETMALAGLQVTICERMPSPARKFLMAGRGGLNLTHSEPMDTFLKRYGQAADWLAGSIETLTPVDLRAWADALGEETFVGSSGRVFPKGFKASPLLRAWLRNLEALGVKLRTRCEWTGWSSDGALSFADGTTMKPDVTVLALGGASWPRLGSDGTWQGILIREGVGIAPLIASNVAVKCDWSDATRERHAGQPLKRIALSIGCRKIEGEALISTTGLEGGVVYALSREMRDALGHGDCDLMLDLRPQVPAANLTASLARVPRKQSLSNRLRKGAGLPPHAVSVWRDFTHPLPETDEALADSIKQVCIKVTGIQSLERAISSAGGILMSEVDSSFMLNVRSGTFVCGEMLDWDAPTGGYLLQACFATGAAAGRGAARFAGAAEQGC